MDTSIRIDPSEPCADCGTTLGEHDAAGCESWALFPSRPTPYVAHPLGEWERRQMADGGDQ